jgi:hypothetical protein
MPSGHDRRPYRRPGPSTSPGRGDELGRGRTGRLRYDGLLPYRSEVTLSDRPSPLLAAGLAALVLAIAACTAPEADGGASASPPPRPSASAETAFSGNGVSFSYPEGWRELKVSDSSASAGSADWSTTVGIDPRNMVSVSRFTLDSAITADNVQARSASIRSQLESLFVQAGGSLQAGPTALEMAGLPALEFSGAARNPIGQRVQSRLVLAFEGTTEYFVNCQYDDSGSERVLSGCDLVVSSFSVSA